MPIPFYGELGAVNPVVVLPGAAAARGAEIASGYAGSLTLGAGQFCTNPGLLFVPDGDLALPAAIAGAVTASSGGPMLSERIYEGYEAALAEIEAHPAVTAVAAGTTGEGPWGATPRLFRTGLAEFAADIAVLAKERFGPAGLMIAYPSPDDLLPVLAALGGNLVGSVHGDTGSAADMAAARRVLAVFERTVGRIVWNGWPTGVAVNAAQQHGGPWPATTVPASTSVGSAAIRRWLVPVAYQGLPAGLLPPGLAGPAGPASRPADGTPARRSAMTVAAYLYPWDVDGDPAAPDRIAGLGVTEVSLAAAYHAVRAVTPFHPGHRVVTRDAAVYYRPDPDRWRGARLRPADPGDGAAGSFERAAAALYAAGLSVNAWVVVAHNGRLGAAHPECAVRNAYGDPYPWALCIGSPDVAGYAATLSAEVAALDGVAGIELEACGWYGYDHGSAHDKAGGPPAGAPGWLLDICFCAACTGALQDAGLDPGELARQVRAALDAAYQGGGLAGLGALAGPFAAVRAATAGAFLRHVLAAARDAAPGRDLWVHSHPDAGQAGANPGYDPGVLLASDGADGIILACPGPADTSAALVRRTARAAPAGRRIAGTFPAVAALGADVSELPGKAGAVLAAGATDLRLYHAGLASGADHAAMRSVAKVSVG